MSPAPFDHKSCPACDYERGSRGNPQQDGQEMRCLDCGTTWREFSDFSYRTKTESVRPIEQNKASLSSSDTSGFMRTQSNPGSNKRRGYSMPKRNFNAFYHAGIASVAFVFCLATSVMFVDSMITPELDYKTTASISKQEHLSISDVSMKVTVRPGGKKVFTVSGKLANSTKTTRSIPPVAILLKSEDGKELHRWYYQAHKPKMEPGKEFQFSSSVQYDTPFVAVAEARFE